MKSSLTAPKFKFSFKKADQWGILCSSLCVAHCLLLPAVIYLIPNLSFMLHNEWVHFSFLFGVVAFGLKGFHFNKVNTCPKVLGSIGILLLIFGAASESFHISEVLTMSFNLIGGISLVIGHFLNLKYPIPKDTP